MVVILEKNYLCKILNTFQNLGCLGIALWLCNLNFYNPLKKYICKLYEFRKDYLPNRKKLEKTTFQAGRS